MLSSQTALTFYSFSFNDTQRLWLTCFSLKYEIASGILLKPIMTKTPDISSYNLLEAGHGQIQIKLYTARKEQISSYTWQ